MNCIYCNAGKTQVIDSRHTLHRLTTTRSLRRRRRCLLCGRRFTTYEVARGELGSLARAARLVHVAADLTPKAAGQ